MVAPPIIDLASGNTCTNEAIISPTTIQDGHNTTPNTTESNTDTNTSDTTNIADTTNTTNITDTTNIATPDITNTIHITDTTDTTNTTDTATTTPKRTREDDIDDQTETKRLCTHTNEQDNDTAVFTIISPDLEIQFPELLDNFLKGDIDDNNTSATPEGLENWFLPNSPICEFDIDSIFVPDTTNDHHSSPPSELPYFENLEQELLENNNVNENNLKELSLADTDSQFWSLLIGNEETIL